MPWPVIEGFTVGIAVIIFLQQVPAALGVPRPDGENTAARRGSRPWVTRVDAGQRSWPSALVARRGDHGRAPRGSTGRSPASLLGVVLADASSPRPPSSTSRSIGALPRRCRRRRCPRFASAASSLHRRRHSPSPCSARLESLLSAKVADGMSDGARHDPDRELFGQGLANLASPLFGGMPATGAIARTAVNVRAGARTRLAAVVHALALVAVVFLGGPLVAEIPLAALAGVLMVTAVRMVDVHNVRGRAPLHPLRRRSSWCSPRRRPCSSTSSSPSRSGWWSRRCSRCARCAHDLRRHRRARLPAARRRRHRRRGGRRCSPSTSSPTGSTAPSSSAPRSGSSSSWPTSSDVRVVILRLPQLQVLDATGAQALGAIVEDLERRGITVLLKGASPEHLRRPAHGRCARPPGPCRPRLRRPRRRRRPRPRARGGAGARARRDLSGAGRGGMCRAGGPAREA